MNKTEQNEIPLVSVWVIVYNHEKYIRDCLDGILMQKVDFPFEVIVHDDCSTDKSRKIISEYIQNFPKKIIPIFQKENLYQQKQNVLEPPFSISKGKYIAYCDGDDYWCDVNKLQKQINVLEDNPQYVMSAHKVKIVTDTEKATPLKYIYDYSKTNILTFKDILYKHSIPTLSLVFRNKNIEFPEWYSKIKSGDIALELLLASHGDCYFFYEKMGVYRQHDGGITKQKRDYEGVYKNSLFMYESLDKHTNGQYHNDIQKVIAKRNFFYALTMLKEKYLLKCIKPFILSLFCSPLLPVQYLYKKLTN